MIVIGKESLNCFSYINFVSDLLRFETIKNFGAAITKYFGIMLLIWAKDLQKFVKIWKSFYCCYFQPSLNQYNYLTFKEYYFSIEFFVFQSVNFTVK